MKPPAPAIPAMGAVVALIGLGLAIGNRDGVLAAFCFSSFTWATFLALELYKK